MEAGEQLSALRAALVERGYQFLDDGSPTEINRALNAVVKRICAWGPFSFMEVTPAAAAPPLQIPRLVAIRYVKRADGQRLRHERLEVLSDRDLTRADLAQCYYVTGGDTIKVWPLDTGLLTVEAYARPLLMATDPDVCIIPASFSGLVLDMAHSELAKQNGQWDIVAGLRQDIVDQKAEFMEAMGSPGEDDELVLLTQDYA